MPTKDKQNGSSLILVIPSHHRRGGNRYQFFGLQNQQPSIESTFYQALGPKRQIESGEATKTTKKRTEKSSHPEA